MSSLAAEAEKIPARRGQGRIRSRGLWWDAWRRLRRNKAAVAGLAFILLMFLVALLAPALAPHDPEKSPQPPGSTPRPSGWTAAIPSTCSGLTASPGTS